MVIPGSQSFAMPWPVGAEILERLDNGDAPARMKQEWSQTDSQMHVPP